MCEWGMIEDIPKILINLTQIHVKVKIKIKV